MLDWIFEGVANWVASIMTQLMDAVSGIFLEALGTDMTAMEEYFPFVVSAYVIIQYAAWALLFLIVIWQLFRTYGGPLTEAESPWQLMARGALFAFLIAYAKPIFWTSPGRPTPPCWTPAWTRATSPSPASRRL